MSFLLHDEFEEFAPAEFRSPERADGQTARPSVQAVSLSQEYKFRIPDVGPIFGRERLVDLVRLSVEQYGATLISGRAGTGKTILAADFARRGSKAAWYSIEAADAEWPQFAESLAHAWRVKTGHLNRALTPSPDAAQISRLLMHFLGNGKHHSRGVLVLDDVHHLFDAGWFPEFFRQMIVALDPKTRLLMLCRSRPSAPLWRLRSKQMLNVIDESIINLTRGESREICAERGLSEVVADEAYDLAFGNIAKLVKILDNIAPRTVFAGAHRAF
ncbi:MAG TPA: AAA family ATPase [Pyrinomonadaceae bacterium]